MANQINTVIVLRNDQTTAWESSDHVMLKGEVGIGYLENGNVIAKLGDGEKTWKNLPQIEGVFEEDLILTYNFGRHTTSNGFVKTAAKGMTTREWLEDALSVTKAPTVTQPTASISASFTPSSGEAGTKITKVTWNGTFTDGTYEYGSKGNSAANSSANTSAASWVVNHGDTQIGTTEDGSVTLDDTIGDDAVTYGVSATVTINAANAYVPYNNVGAEVEGSKITGFDTNGTQTKTVTGSASVTGYRKPFWGIKAAGEAINAETITSAQVRALGNSATKTKGFPTSLAVPANSQQVFFLAKAGTYSSLSAKDTAAMNAGVTFTKKAKAVKVEGANGYEAVEYDMWYVDWLAGIDSAKSLSLTWA